MGITFSRKLHNLRLIAASKDPELYRTACGLIGLGANPNAFRHGYDSGTPLHFAVKNRASDIVDILLVLGANPLIQNYHFQTPLDIARKMGHTTFVRKIEDRICYFSGWLQGLQGPISGKKVWVVVIPRTSTKLQKRRKRMNLYVYSSLEDVQPCSKIALWKAKIEEVKFDQSDPVVTILDKRAKTEYKFASVNTSGQHQLGMLCVACRGISKVHNISSYYQKEHEEEREFWRPYLASHPSATATWSSRANLGQNGGIPTGRDATPWRAKSSLGCGESGSSSSSFQDSIADIAIKSKIPEPTLIPSVAEETTSEDKKDVGGSYSSSCLMCMDAAIDGVCVPCGHLAGCMSCLKRIKDKNQGCPVCRATLDQVIRVYTV